MLSVSLAADFFLSNGIFFDSFFFMCLCQEPNVLLSFFVVVVCFLVVLVLFSFVFLKQYYDNYTIWKGCVLKKELKSVDSE